MSAEPAVFSIQRTYILKPVFMHNKVILTCDERIDIPTIEPLKNVQPALFVEQPLTVIPCIELAGEFLSELNLTFETNEGVTVLPIKIAPGQNDPLENPYSNFRYVLVLPRGTTGVKSCKIIAKDFGQEVPHNFTFGIMPPPYNYDNALFGYYTLSTFKIIDDFEQKLSNLRIIPNSIFFQPIHLPKGEGKKTIHIEDGMLSFSVSFIYPLSSESTIHKPKITLHDVTSNRDLVYTLSLNKTENTVSIDLFAGIITAYDSANGEIIQQFMLNNYHELNILGFENFDDIDTSYLNVLPKGAKVKYE